MKIIFTITLGFFPPFDFYTDIQDVLRMFCNYKLNHCKFRKKK